MTGATRDIALQGEDDSMLCVLVKCLRRLGNVVVLLHLQSPALTRPSTTAGWSTLAQRPRLGLSHDISTVTSSLLHICTVLHAPYHINANFTILHHHQPSISVQGSFMSSGDTLLHAL
jgi:hypothetical protein